MSEARADLRIIVRHKSCAFPSSSEHSWGHAYVVPLHTVELPEGHFLLGNHVVHLGRLLFFGPQDP